MASLRQLTHKLQTALHQKGRHITIHQIQIYLPQQERTVTKYVLKEQMKSECGKQKNVTILETYHLSDVVCKLAALYGGDES